MKREEYLCVIIVKNGKVLCCESKSLPGKWAFPYTDAPHVPFPGEAKRKLLKEMFYGDLEEDYAWRSFYEDKTEGISINVISCSSKSGNIRPAESLKTKWLGENELDSVEWEPLFAELIDDLKKQLVRSKYTVAVDYSDGTRDTVWQGTCSRIEVGSKFKNAIQDQVVKYEKDKKKCKVCVYDKQDSLILQETFH